MLMEFVCSFGLRPVLAMRMHRFYGEEAMETLKENPYVLCSALIGGTFAEADTMALELGMEEIIKMETLEESVIGEIPQYRELDPVARTLVREIGVEPAKPEPGVDLS